MTFRMTWEGDAIEAKTVGGVIENTRKLLVSAAKDSGCGNYAVMMDGIDWGDKEASFHFLLIAKPGRSVPMIGGNDG
ncbi:hypothetical protein CSC70_04015 [Pseudoxanthomonas kalamensis DSM 18571]|nr:hypothetical protein CSC70_04015 [Pseudoxanthomonas kalamensis DSM 18571]